VKRKEAIVADSDEKTPTPDEAATAAERSRASEARAQERARTRKAEEPEEFPVERFLGEESVAFFGVPNHVVAGALDHARITKRHATVAEVQEAIESFGDRVTNPDPAEAEEA
jgi:hypothetical protein